MASWLRRTGLAALLALAYEARRRRDRPRRAALDVGWVVEAAESPVEAPGQDIEGPDVPPNEAAPLDHGRSSG